MGTFQEIFNAIVYLASLGGYTFAGTSADVVALKQLINQFHKNIVILGKDWEQEATATITTVASQQAYSFPADFNRIYSLIDQKNRVVERVSSAVFDDLTSNETVSTSDTVTHYSVKAGSLVLYPTPNFADDFTITYNKICPTLVNGTDAILIKTGFEILLVYACLVMIYLKREEPGVSASYENKYLDLLEKYKSSSDGVSDSVLIPYAPTDYRNPNDYPSAI